MNRYINLILQLLCSTNRSLVNEVNKLALNTNGLVDSVVFEPENIRMFLHVHRVTIIISSLPNL